MGYSRGTWRPKLSKYVTKNMNLTKHKNFILAFTIFFISSCQIAQNEITEPDINTIVISEDAVSYTHLTLPTICSV